MMNNNFGRRIDGRYEITELIGIGGMAEVYKAIDVMENKTVAVKILKAEFSRNEDFIRRFRNESKAIAVLSHPNIVKVFDVGFNDDIQYIVMEYIDGITLKEFMEQQGALRWRDAVHFTVQILRALQHAHDRGIVHRDIKPQNIMLFTDGTIKVMDFGIARFSREEGKTLNDKTIGSVHYISPEQARGDLTDERTDIYSVGAMLYEMLTGQKAFEADAPVAVALMHMHDSPAMPRQINPTIPIALEEIIMYAMQKNVNQRYQSAASMINDIDEFKANPNIVFGYRFNNGPVNNEDKTMMFDSLGEKNINDPYGPEDMGDDQYLEDAEPKKKSYLFPVLGGATVAVVLITVIVIFMTLMGGDKNTVANTEVVPDLVGKTFDEMQEQYQGWNFEKTEVFNEQYDAGTIISQDPSKGTKVSKGTTIRIEVSKGSEDITIPDVEGKTKEDAEQKLRDAGFDVAFESNYDDNNTGIAIGSVLYTAPLGNTKAKKGSTVTITLSDGPSFTNTKVPNLYGLSEQEAIARLKNANLKVGNIVREESSEPKDKVFKQNPGKTTTVKMDSKVDIYISTGQQQQNNPVLFSDNVDIPIQAGGAAQNNNTEYKFQFLNKFSQNFTLNGSNSQPVSIFKEFRDGDKVTIKLISPKGSENYAVATFDANSKKFNIQVTNQSAFNKLKEEEEEESSSSSLPDTTLPDPNEEQTE